MKYYPESNQSKSPEGCPSLGVASWNDYKSEQTLTIGSRERARTENDGQMPLMFPHKYSLSIVTKPSSGLCLELGARVGPQEALPGPTARTFHRGRNTQHFVSQSWFSRPPHRRWPLSLTQKRTGLSHPPLYPHCLGVLGEYQLNY